uniref:Uncharacterized protein n=1 Tax=Phlebotomus papatasi TaxID=29031 RepID=A0A1B0EYZ9_PHLPP
MGFGLARKITAIVRIAFQAVDARPNVTPNSVPAIWLSGSVIRISVKCAELINLNSTRSRAKMSQFSVDCVEYLLLPSDQTHTTADMSWSTSFEPSHSNWSGRPSATPGKVIDQTLSIQSDY